MKIKYITTIMTALTAFALPLTGQASDVNPAEARAIAKEAAVYGFPVVDNYRVNYEYFFKPGTPEYKSRRTRS